jgi:hypothetical protein
VHQARAELLEELPLAENVAQLAADALRRDALLAPRGPRVPDERRAQAHPADEQQDRDRDDGGEDAGG